MKINIIALLLIIILLVVIGINIYNNRNWDKSSLCIDWELQGNKTCENPTNDCSNIESEKNSWMQECSCQDGNLTQKIICMKKTEVWGYKE